MKALKTDSLMEVGFISRSFGYKGEVVFIPSFIDPDKLVKKKFLFILLEGLPVPFAVEKIHEKSGDFLVKFEHVDTEAEARKLVQKKVLSEKTKRIPAREWNWKDTAGYEAVDSTFGSLGPIEEIQEFPLQMIAKCTVRGKEVLFPLNETIVVEVDEKKRKMLIDLPEGLLDLYLGS